MLRHFRLTLILAISALAIGGLVSLNVTHTLTWARDSVVHEEKASHTHGT